MYQHASVLVQEAAPLRPVSLDMQLSAVAASLEEMHMQIAQSKALLDNLVWLSWIACQTSKMLPCPQLHAPQRHRLPQLIAATIHSL